MADGFTFANATADAPSLMGVRTGALDSVVACDVSGDGSGVYGVWAAPAVDQAPMGMQCFGIQIGLAQWTENGGRPPVYEYVGLLAAN